MGARGVFAASIAALKAAGASVTVFSSSGPGFLDGVGDHQKNIPYRWHANRWIRLWNFMTSQLFLMIRLLLHHRGASTIYVNTLLPFGAAIAGKLMGSEVVYHFHETHVEPASLNRLLRFWARWTAKGGIAVSHFLKETLALPSIPIQVIPNALPAELVPDALPASKPGPFTVLMISSLKKEKGLWEFVELAQRLPQFQFELVLGAKQAAVDAFWGNAVFPKNLSCYARQADVKPFYHRAHLLINLSDPVLLPETFGMTIIEGMAYGLPAIVPPVGGPAELVTPAVEGFLIDGRDVDALVEGIAGLAQSPERWGELAQAAKAKSATFSPEAFKTAIQQHFR